MIVKNLLPNRFISTIYLLVVMLIIVFTLLNVVIAYIVVRETSLLNTQKSYEDTIDKWSIFVNHSNVKEIKHQ